MDVRSVVRKFQFPLAPPVLLRRDLPAQSSVLSDRAVKAAARLILVTISISTAIAVFAIVM
jgi:hypothetical protein